MKIKMEDSKIKLPVPKVNQKYHIYYKEWSCFIKSNNLLNPVLCIHCGRHFSIGSSGHDHFVQQYLSKKHEDNARYKVQNILVLKFLKESISENNII